MLYLISCRKECVDDGHDEANVHLIGCPHGRHMLTHPNTDGKKVRFLTRAAPQEPPRPPMIARRQAHPPPELFKPVSTASSRTSSPNELS